MTSLPFSVERTSSPTPPERLAEILANPGFGQYFTDHMVCIEWSEEKGWHDAKVRPYAPLSLDPSTSVFHYGQAIFEGIKAYRQEDGSIKTFRPEANAQRLQRSAARIRMPELPEELFIESLRQLVEIDQAWVPAAGGEESLYLRPFMISTESTLGVHPSNSYTYMVIASPAGAYFSGGVKPVSVWLCEDYVRAAPGGTGDAKFAGNYAASLLAQAQAAEKGCDQVVWLDAIQHKFVEEMGGMNLFFVLGEGADAHVVTPELSGSLLPGITRDSLLQVARDRGYTTEERRIDIAEWEQKATSGEMSETFACGTAAVITPVGRALSNHGEFSIHGGEAGPITMELREILTGIQRGSVEDTHGWMHTLIPAQ
ncbi:branched-chain amino acid aminotransferase [Corynebacterium sp. 153RC1]|uniref:branched-chain amino acid aminotransferase n=1 Tax=unclassified Corynebacterium TaxID=2624378 RepID=UPI00211BFF57|nr:MULTISPECIES: branched-chain amino acid aminotransferase [unclassified Corynebacterium]MCQ9369840.1 branched-chain amino acid aminotransferase [Corynebacterium sp. 35RC1]MCQ9352285.1 branched-chain amino acid aminotransferase [Corynebacterium sp. 209RC1]MCQ9354325.1 branched-chain amino acid aminotransferase [Corynebacterium sp. 1222RC1]MCQ9356607.1 branched-chain amino acid aminotransferase [Corynebacterium sp. 122RC1]MCQ9359617.1 branched-chain amino acid aminotransferase [Corynebacterium